LAEVWEFFDDFAVNMPRKRSGQRERVREEQKVVRT